jgi:AcrR family transcriptional regulator
VGTALADRRVSLSDDVTVASESELALVPGVAAHGLPPSPRAADSRARILDAALRCVGRFGVGKTKIDDIAREARFSRATIYRLFPGGRDEILKSMIGREVAGFFARLAARLEEVDDFSERIVVAMVTTSELIAAHEPLRYVMANEPELILNHVTFAGLDDVLEAAAGFFAPYLAEMLKPEDAERVAEWVGRLVLSHVVCSHDQLENAWALPRSNTSLGSGESPFAIHPGSLSQSQARWLVSQFVMPGIVSYTSASVAPSAL